MCLKLFAQAKSLAVTRAFRVLSIVCGTFAKMTTISHCGLIKLVTADHMHIECAMAFSSWTPESTYWSVCPVKC